MVIESDSCNFREMAELYGTPFYCYNGEKLSEKAKMIRSFLHPAINIFYSVKANPNVFLINRLFHLGCGVEVSSKGELILALAAGVTPERIIFSGPGKTREELEFAVQQHIHCIIAESFDEVRLINAVALVHHCIVRVMVRVNPDSLSNASLIGMGGMARPFGVDEEQLDELLPELLSYPNLHFVGIHIYMGTQVLDVNQIIKSASYIITLAHKIHEKYGIICEIIDLGGGWGVPYFSHEQALDLPVLADQLNELISNTGKSVLSKTQYIVELGRYLVAECGTYVAKVLYKKKSKGETFVIVDGGMNHHAAAAFRGRMMRNNFPVKVVCIGPEKGKLEKVTVVGPLCTPEDCLIKLGDLPVMEVGDLVCIQKSGAYGLTFSPLFFLGHPIPAEIWFERDEHRIIRSRGSESDILKRQFTQVEMRSNDQFR